MAKEVKDLVINDIDGAVAKVSLNKKTAIVSCDREIDVLAFEQLSYNSDVHNLRGVEGIIGGTWMDKSELEDGSCAGYTYAQVILQSGISSGVSPYHLASRIFQEQGFMGNSPLISGQYGVYNYYNIGAYGSTNQQVINSGVNYARNKGWTTRFKALMEGAEFIGKNYILRGQDVTYLFRIHSRSRKSLLLSVQSR